MNHSSLIGTLRRRDPLLVSAGVAALSLLPPNAGHLARLRALSLETLGTKATRHEPVRHSDWRRILVDAPSLHQGPAWDPPEGPFAVPVTGPGGSYVVATAGEPEAGNDLQLVIDALFLASWPEDATPTCRRASAVLVGGLRIMDHVCSVANLNRYEPIGHADRILIPPSDDLERRTNGLCFTVDELEAIAGRPLASLMPLIHDLDSGPLPSTTIEQTGTSRLEITPLVRRGDSIVVASPLALPVAVRHQTVLTMIDGGLKEDFVEALALAATSRVQRACQLMRWVENAQPPPTDRTNSRRLLFAIDQDKVAHVIVWCDDLSDYSEDDPRGFWDASSANGPIESQILEAERAMLMGPPPRPNGPSPF